jgi:SAM-dependent methyltransferase
MATNILGFLFKWWRSYVDWRFDRRYSVDTSGTFPVADAPSESNPYAGTPPYRFYQMLSAVPLDPKDATFVDYGCGKGRALIMASELGFHRIVGLELSPELSAIAQNNLRSYEKTRKHSSRVEVICQDAAQFSIPHGKCVLYLYNPFHESVMRAVLGKIRLAIEEGSKGIFVVYYNPRLKHLFDGSGFLRLIHERRQFAVYTAK